MLPTRLREQARQRHPVASQALLSLRPQARHQHPVVVQNHQDFRHFRRAGMVCPADPNCPTGPMYPFRAPDLAHLVTGEEKHHLGNQETIVRLESREMPEMPGTPEALTILVTYVILATLAILGTLEKFGNLVNPASLETHENHEKPIHARTVMQPAAERPETIGHQTTPVRIDRESLHRQTGGRRKLPRGMLSFGQRGTGRIEQSLRDDGASPHPHRIESRARLGIGHHTDPAASIPGRQESTLRPLQQ